MAERPDPAPDPAPVGADGPAPGPGPGLRPGAAPAPEAVPHVPPAAIAGSAEAPAAAAPALASLADPASSAVSPPMPAAPKAPSPETARSPSSMSPTPPQPTPPQTTPPQTTPPQTAPPQTAPPPPAPLSGGSAAAPVSPRPPRSLASRVALAMAAVLGAGGAVVLVAALAYGREAAGEAYDRLLIGAASDIAGSIAVRDGAALVDLPMSAFQLLALAPDDRIRYRVIGPHGATLTGDAAAPLPDRRGDVVFYDGAFGDEPARYVAVTRRFAERAFSGPVRVVVGQTLRARRALARDIARNALLVLAGAGAAMALLAFAAMRSALAPLTRIGAALSRREPTDLTPLSLPVPREVAPLLGALNSFMARLERQVSASRDLIGDSAHQLRTPVAAIRAQAQLAAGEPDPARRDRIVARIHDRAVGLGRLLDQMLSRAMVMHRTEAEPREILDLRDIAVEVLEQGDADVFASGAPVRLELPDGPVRVRGDAASLTEAGKNLLGNALRHGRAPIRIGASGGAEARLWVSDAGEGPPATILADPGARFASGGAAGGSGLGLAIARAVAAGHGGRLTLGRRDGRFEAAVVLPEASE